MSISSNIENQYSISKWAVDTFGEAGSNASCAARANAEMAELIQALASNDNHPNASAEVADVLICLYRLADRLDIDLHDAVDEKMAINRARKWKLDGNGHGSHVKEPIRDHKEPVLPLWSREPGEGDHSKTTMRPVPPSWDACVGYENNCDCDDCYIRRVYG